MHYTISQDHTGGPEAVAGARLAALGHRSRGGDHFLAACLAAWEQPLPWPLPPLPPLPRLDLPEENVLQVHSSKISIEFTAQRQPSQSTITIEARFSNTTSQPISEMYFQLDVEKNYVLVLFAQNGRELGPHQLDGIQQEILLTGVYMGEGNAVKMRFQVSYQAHDFRGEGQLFDESGDVPSLGIM